MHFEKSVSNLRPWSRFKCHLDTFNESILDATRDFEPRQQLNGIENTARRARGEGIERIDDPTRQLFQDRREMGTQYMEQLKELLGRECFETLDGARRYLPRAATPTAGGVPKAKPGGLTSGASSKGADRSKAGRSLQNREPAGGNRKPGDRDKDRGR